jgi:hypothetical protein
LETYEQIPEIRCQLVFVLQSIKDYHIPAEYTFNKIDKTTQIFLQHEYTLVIDAYLTETDPRICNSLPVDSQSNIDSSNGASDGGPLAEDAALGVEITRWLNNDYFQPDDGDNKFFKDYKTTEAFILLHALSVGSRGKDARSEWRKSAAERMIQLETPRFILCQGITLSLFLRLQKQILNTDNVVAVDQLMKLWQLNLWPRSLNSPEAKHIRVHLRNILNPRRYPRGFWLPSTGRLGNRVFQNVQIYIAEAFSYFKHLKNISPGHARATQAFVCEVWEVLVATLGPQPDPSDQDTLNQTTEFLRSTNWHMLEPFYTEIA